MMYENVAVRIPSWDEGGFLHYLILKISGKITHTKLINGIRQVVKETFKTTVTKKWVEENCIITDIDKFNAENAQPVTPDLQQERMDRLYIKLQQEQNDIDKALNEGHPDGEAEITKVSGEPLSNMSH